MTNYDFTDDNDINANEKINDLKNQRNALLNLTEEEEFRNNQYAIRNVETRKMVLFVIMVFVIMALYGFAAALAIEALSILKEIKIITLEFPKEVGQMAFTSPIDWHVIFIITSFLIPPTILSFMLLKGVYGITKGSDTPVGEILTQVKETVENVKGIAEALAPQPKD